MAETRLVHYDQARRELALASSIDEVKMIRDQAEAIRQYIKQQKGSFEMQNQAAEIKLRAERRAGEILKEREIPVANQYSATSHDVIKQPPTLKELEITPMQSMRWQAEAEIPEERFEQFIAETKAAAEELTSKAALNIALKMKHEEERKDKVSRPLPEGIFNVIYADPPWKYENSGFAMSAEKHYEVMDLYDIQVLPIGKHTPSDAILFLWATNPLLQDAFSVIESWGFEYKTNMVWVKDNATAGFYVRGQHELLLICTKGSLLPSGDLPISIINGKNDIHSKKPEIVYSIIENMFPGATKCELFARSQRAGWTSWGNEVNA